jgi:hypothetical protein
VALSSPVDLKGFNHRKDFRKNVFKLWFGTIRLTNDKDAEKDLRAPVFSLIQVEGCLKNEIFARLGY